MSSDPRFTDLLSDRRRDQSHLLWLALHDCSSPQHAESLTRTPAQIRDSVLQHEAVRSLLSRSPELRPRVVAILDEMAHTWSLNGIRVVGYFVTKIMTQICAHVWVDRHIRIDKRWPPFCGPQFELRNGIGFLVADSPVIYLPTHRSYADFVLLSYVCFTMRLPLPSIAAGDDFLSLKQAAALLRACGAFFIRRSTLRDDELYWPTLRAYVEEQVAGGERPLEFFAEGTRSRTGKALPPKTGLLAIAVSLFLTGRVTDLILLPICISYDRLLEESLYATEVSPGSTGGKPKETMSHLIAGARSILNQNYGSVYVTFCQPISVRQASYSFCGQDVRKKLSSDNSLRTQFVSELAKQVIRQQVSATIVSAFDVFAFVVLAQHANMRSIPCGPEQKSLPISLHAVLRAMTAVRTLIPSENLGHDALTLTPSNLRNTFRIHEEKFVTIADDELVLKWDTVSRNMLRIYGNKALQLLIHDSICCYVKSSAERFQKVVRLLEIEFCVLDDQFLDSVFAKSSQRATLLSSDVCSLLASFVFFSLNSYHELSCWLLTSVAAGQETGLLLDLKSLTSRAQRDLSLSSDVISNFWTLIKRRVAPADVSVHVIHGMREELAQLVPANGDARDGHRVESKL